MRWNTNKNWQKKFYSSAVAAVFTYKIKRKEVGIKINKAVAVNPKMFTSIINL